MDLHQNARLSFRSRETLANQITIEKVTLKAAAAAFKVSRQTAAKWVHRYRTLGLPGLRDRSPRPFIARAEPRRSGSLRSSLCVASCAPPDHLAQATGLSPDTVSRIPAA